MLIERRLAPETTLQLKALIGLDVGMIATDDLHIYEHRDYFGCYEIGFRNDTERSLRSFSTRWETHGNEDIHLFQCVSEGDSRIPRDASRKRFSVGPTSTIDFANRRTLQQIDVVQLELHDVSVNNEPAHIVYDWALVLAFDDTSRLSLCTLENSILGEIEIRLSGNLGELRENITASTYQTIN